MPPPDFMHGLGKGGRTPSRGGHFATGHPRGSRTRVTPLTNPSPITFVSHTPINGKRPGDGVVDENRPKKRRKTSTTIPSHSPLATKGSASTGNTKENPIEIPDDPPEATSPGFKRHVEGNSFDTSPSQTRPAHRYSTPLDPSTPTRRVNEKPEVIVVFDDEDDSTAPSRSTLRNAAQSGVTKSQSGLMTPETPSRFKQLDDPLLQGHELNHGQAPPANSAHEQDATVSTPAQPQTSSTFRTLFRHDQLTNGSPGTSKNMAAPLKPAPAQEGTERVDPANRSMSVVQGREADQYQVPQGFDSVPQVAVRESDTGARNIDDETKNRVNERSEGGRVDAGGANRSDAVLDETKNLSPTDRFMESQMLLRSATAGASQIQEPPGLAVPAQAQKQTELVGDGRSDGGDERARRRSTSLRSNTGYKNDPRGKPRTQLKREKKTRIVALKAPPDELHRISLRPVQRPEIPMSTGTCFLIQIRPEIQENIFKYLLLADDPIQVLEQWSKLKHGQPSGLHPAILRTCKTMFNNASAFLYGRNVFQYLVRDMTQPGASRPPKLDNRYIDVAKYVPLFRKLELKIERRTESGYCGSLTSAICLLNRCGAELHTLTLDVSPSVEGDTLSVVGYFFRGGAIVKALKALRTCFITVLVFPPEAQDDPTLRLRRNLDMRTELGVLEEGPKQSPAMQLDDLSEMITFACESPDEVVEQGLFEEFNVKPRQDERSARRRARIAYFANEGDSDADDADENDEDGDYMD